VYAPTELINQTLFALAAAVKILDHYEHFFGVKYPLPKQGKNAHYAADEKLPIFSLIKLIDTGC
jgi:aminopeptidase N